MPSMTVEIMPIARDDVDQTLIYIASDDPAAEDRLYDAILEKLNQVALQPYLAPEVQIGRRIYRKLYVHSYNLYYRIIRDKIIIMRVLHERMDTRKYL